MQYNISTPPPVTDNIKIYNCQFYFLPNHSILYIYIFDNFSYLYVLLLNIFSGNKTKCLKTSIMNTVYILNILKTKHFETGLKHHFETGLKHQSKKQETLT